MKNKILNSKGEEIVLNAREQKVANLLQRKSNSLGYEIPITTLTTIMKKVSEQKFFEIAPADYLPVRVGEGSWSTSLTTYLSSALAADFSEGVINTGGNNGKLAGADAGVDSVDVKVLNWAKSIGWSLFDLEHAAKSGNWDLVTAKEKARKKNWDLGIQKVAFLGLEGNSAVQGLLTQSGITPDTSVIGEQLKGMTSTELSTFLTTILGKYRINCAYTAMPTHFILPEEDFLGLAAPSNDQYPLKSKLGLMLETFQVMTGNKEFKILPCAYASAANSGLLKDRYALYNYEEESLRMDIPVDYTSTLANSIDNFSFQNVGYGQFTGAKAYRPKELMYFDLP